VSRRLSDPSPWIVRTCSRSPVRRNSPESSPVLANSLSNRPRRSPSTFTSTNAAGLKN
jgi:hypothetical protein